jgi:DNA-binding transcriptional MerR regulator
MSYDSHRSPGGWSGNGSGRRPPPGRPAAIPRPPEPHRYTLQDLERETGVNGRTIRYYISEGLLPPAHGRGPSATYDLGHLLRLRLIRSLKDQRISLGEIRARLGDLSDQDIAALLNIQTEPAEDVWRRITLHPDIEIHVRQRPGSQKALTRAVDLIVGLAQPVIERMERGDE